MKTFCYETKIGRISISEDEHGICSITTEQDNEYTNYFETENIKNAYMQMSEYLDGKRKTFDMKLSTKGTEFQEKVWDELLKIPYGEILSYGDIASNMQNPKASRAVGGACNKNPIMIVIPCHRVVGSDKSLTGYALGLDIKRKLLDLENIHF